LGKIVNVVGPTKFFLSSLGGAHAPNAPPGYAYGLGDVCVWILAHYFVKVKKLASNLVLCVAILQSCRWI